MKRFFKSADVREQDGTFAVMLDGRPIKTPNGGVLALRSSRLADAIAAEWAGQADEFELEPMVLTRLAFGAIDGEARRGEIVSAILKFAGSDLTCYRAEGPAELVRRQAAAWDGPLAGVAARTCASFRTTTGVTHIAQPPETIAALEQAIMGRDTAALVALNAATGILGSLVLALNLAGGKLDARTAFAAAHIDESFQAEKWGEDPEARRRLDRLQTELESVETFLRLL
ncbi:MAG: ATP12 family chaperone protein [Rhizomicrobium sp.]